MRGILYETLFTLEVLVNKCVGLKNLSLFPNFLEDPMTNQYHSRSIVVTALALLATCGNYIGTFLKQVFIPQLTVTGSGNIIMYQLALKRRESSEAQKNLLGAKNGKLNRQAVSGLFHTRVSNNSSDHLRHLRRL